MAFAHGRERQSRPTSHCTPRLTRTLWPLHTDGNVKAAPPHIALPARHGRYGLRTRTGTSKPPHLTLHSPLDTDAMAFAHGRERHSALTSRCTPRLKRPSSVRT